MAEREPPWAKQMAAAYQREQALRARVETRCAGCSKQLLHRTVCRRCQTPYCGPGCASRHESAHSLVCRKIAQGISDEVAAPWPPSAGAKVEYELNGRWFPGCISMASPTTLYFRYAARCLKNEEPIERNDLVRLRPQRRLRRGDVLLHGWPAAVVELLGQRLPEPLAFAVAGYACGPVREFRIPDGHQAIGQMECPALTPDGKCLVVATVGPEEENFSVMFYSLESGECVRTLKNDPDYKMHPIGAAWITVFFPEGGPWQSCKVWLVAVYMNFDGPEDCVVVDLETNEVISEVGSDEDHLGQVYASSKAQAYAVTVNDKNEYRMVDLATGGVIRSGEAYRRLDDEEICMRASPDGSHALLMHTTSTNGHFSVESWPLGAQGTGHRLEHPDVEPDPSLPLAHGALVVDIDHGGRRGRVLGDPYPRWTVQFDGVGKVQLDAKSLRVIPRDREDRARVKKLCPTNGAHMLTLTERELRLWDRTTGQCIRTLCPPSNSYYSNFGDYIFVDVCATPDGTHAVTASKYKPEDRHGAQMNLWFHVWDLRTGERASSLQLTDVDQRRITFWDDVAAMDITPDGHWLVVKSEGTYGVYWI